MNRVIHKKSYVKNIIYTLAPLYIRIHLVAPQSAPMAAVEDSDNETVSDDGNTLSPVLEASIRRIYNAADSPINDDYLDRYYVAGNGPLGADEWYNKASNGHLLIRFPARINRNHKDTKLTSYGNKEGTTEKVRMINDIYNRWY
jgi:hypothetical protein